MNPKMDGVNAEITTPSALSSPPASLPAGTKIALAGVTMQLLPSFANIYTNIRARYFAGKIDSSSAIDFNEMYAANLDLRIVLFMASLLAFIGAGMMLWSVFRHQCRAQWLFWGLFYAAFKNFAFCIPIGPVLSVALVTTAILKRKEFGR